MIELYLLLLLTIIIIIISEFYSDNIYEQEIFEQIHINRENFIPTPPPSP
jgi:hypothetical protein